LISGEPNSQTIDPLLASGNEITFHYVTDKTNLEISGYTRSSINGDPVSGTIDEDLLIKVYYRANEVVIEEPEPPLGPVSPDSEPSELRQELIIIDDSTPLGELPKTGTTSATASPLGPLGAYLVPPSLEGILDLKKEEDDDNQDC